MNPKTRGFAEHQWFDHWHIQSSIIEVFDKVPPTFRNAALQKWLADLRKAVDISDIQLDLSSEQDPGRPFVAKEHDEFEERCKVWSPSIGELWTNFLVQLQEDVQKLFSLSKKSELSVNGTKRLRTVKLKCVSSLKFWTVKRLQDICESPSFLLLLLLLGVVAEIAVVVVLVVLVVVVNVHACFWGFMSKSIYYI